MAKKFVLALLQALAFASPLSRSTHSFQSSPYDSSPHHSLEKRRPLPPFPDNDPWYAAPANFTSANPGDILKWRVAPRPLSIDNSSPLKLAGLYQIQYRTQNSVGEPIANVLTAAIPYNANLNALFTYHYFSDSACPNCNPSVAMTLVESAPMIFTKEQLGPLIAALNQGWIVCVPDDGGPQASFPAGPGMAYTTLDSIRAMLKSQAITGLNPAATVTLNGYSGGGIASAWTGELHPIYAPELKIDGIALGGLVPDFVYLSNVIKAGQGYFAWGPVVYAGLSHDYRDLSDWLDQNLVPENATAFWGAETYCIQQSADLYTTINTCEYFTRGCAAWNDPIPSQVLYNATTMGMRATPIAPWYLYETVGDETSPVNITRALYDKYCAQGANIYYEENQMNVAHATESVLGFPGAFEWMKERHAGIPIPFTGCQKVNVSTQTTTSGWPLPIMVTVYQALLAEFGASVGNFWWSNI